MTVLAPLQLARFADEDWCDHAPAIVREILLLRIDTHVLEWQDGYRRLVGNGRGRFGWCDWRDAGSGTIARTGVAIFLDCRSPASSKVVDLSWYLIVDLAGNAARLCQRFESRGNVDAIAEYVVVLNNDIPNVDADSSCSSRSGRSGL